MTSMLSALFSSTMGHRAVETNLFMRVLCLSLEMISMLEQVLIKRRISVAQFLAIRVVNSEEILS